MKARLLFLLCVFALQAIPALAQDYLKRVKPWLFPFDLLEAREVKQPPQPALFRNGRHFEDKRMPQLANASPALSESQSFSDSVQALWVRHYISGHNYGADGASAMSVDAAGNVYVTGYSYGSGTSKDYVTIKYNAAGIEQWVARYNGPGYDDDEAFALVVDAVGNAYVTGYSLDSGTSRDYATIKYNASGVEQWVARYNGPGNDDDEAFALVVDAVGNVYVTGYSLGSGTSRDYATIKYNASGTQQWVARYNGPGDGDDRATALAIDAAGNVYVTGYSYGSGTSRDDYATIKYNASGTQQWIARYNGPGNNLDRATALAVDTIGNVYATGSSYNLFTSYDYATIKYNAAGTQQWVARYNGPRNNFDHATALAMDAAGNIYVTGSSNALDITDDYATIKYDSSGVEQWVARYNGPGNHNDYAFALAVDAAGNTYVTGSSHGSFTSSDYATIKYNVAGIQQWEARYNGPVNGFDEAVACAVDTAGNIYVAGSSYGSSTFYDYASIKYNAAGIQQWETRYNGPGYGDDQATALAVDGGGNIYVTGSSYGSSTSSDYATIKYNAAGIQQWEARYNGPGNYLDVATALAVDAVGDIYVTGSSHSTSPDYTTIKYNASGIEQWVARYTGPGYSDQAEAIAVDSAGNVYVTGSSEVVGIRVYATIKYNASGIQQWVARYNGPGNNDNQAFALAVDATGNAYVTGFSSGSGTFNDYATIKYNASGVQQWVGRYNGPGNNDDKAFALAVGAAGNVYVTGSSFGSGTSSDYATIKYNASGVQQWVGRYNGLVNQVDQATALAMDQAGNVYVTGYSYGPDSPGDYATIKYDASGVEQWVARYNGPGYGSDEANALAVDASGNVYVTGYSYGSGTSNDYATIKYNASGIELWVARYYGAGISDNRAVALALDVTSNVYVTGSTNYAEKQNVYTTIKYPQSASLLKASTEHVTNVTATSVTLNGRVNPNELSMAVRFEYGTTRGYGDTIMASPGIVTGTNDAFVSANLSHLTLNTTYHFRVFGTYEGGLIEGEDQTFQTLTCAAASVIDHTQLPSPSAENSKITLTAEVLAVCDIESVVLKYRRAGDVDFLIAEKSDSLGSFNWTIPASAVTFRGVEYYITARFPSGTDQQLPAKGVFSIPIAITQGLSREKAQPHGSEQNAYRLISMPLALDDSSATRLLQDDLGPYDNKKWRLFALQPRDTTYTEYSESLQIEPGKAYFLIVKDAGKVLDTGVGTSIRTDRKFAIPLYPKWNFIGNPFSFAIPLSKLSLKSPRDRILRYHEGTWRDPFIRNLTHIQPFEGYAIFNISPNIDTLFIDPQITPAPGGLRKEFSATFAEKTLWSIRMLAQCQEASDEDNIAAIVSDAASNWDEMDQPEPPPIGEYVSVYFPHSEWKALAKTYCLDARPELHEGEVWEFEVKTNIRDKVNLTFNGIESVPPEFEVWLADDALHITQNLREKSVYTIAGTQHPKRLRLVVGKSDFINQKLAEAQLIPTQYELSQNFPNPFNPVTTIRYGLPRPERVSLRVYNLLGEEVAALVNDEAKTAGYHAAIWDGRNKNGQHVASGVYVYRLRAGSFVKTQKMALVK